MGTPGYRLELGTGRGTYEYHASLGGNLVACSVKTRETADGVLSTRQIGEAVRPLATPEVAALPTPTTWRVPALETAAREDAARRAGVRQQDVAIRSIGKIWFRSGAYGCPEPNMVYHAATTRGYRVIMDAGERTLEYHSVEEGDLFYCANPTS